MCRSPTTPGRYYTLRVEAQGSRLRGFIDDRLVAEAVDEELRAGLGRSHGESSRAISALFGDDRPGRCAGDRGARRRSRGDGGAAPGPAADAGAVAEVRDAAIRRRAQRSIRRPRRRRSASICCSPRMCRSVRGDAFDHISCLTAVTFDGTVLWQQGRPEPCATPCLPTTRRFRSTISTAMARTEVVLARDFQFAGARRCDRQALERKVWLPKVAADASAAALRLQHRRLDLCSRTYTGRWTRVTTSCIKDRYRRFWVFDNVADSSSVEGEGQVGHYPYPFDVGR